MFTIVVAMILASAVVGLFMLALIHPDFLSDYFRDTLIVPDWGMND